MYIHIYGYALRPWVNTHTNTNSARANSAAPCVAATDIYLKVLCSY